MPRYRTDIATPYPPEQAAAIVAQFLGRYGFVYTTERGEPVFKTGGTWVIPQFVKAEPAPGRVHIEAWCARVSIIPGMYFGEQDLDGVWGVLTVRAHQKRVHDLERLLSGDVPGLDAMAPDVAAGTTAAWHPDPTGRHQFRYWDGSAWTVSVSDHGVPGTDPL